MNFQPVPEPKLGKTRIHLDFWVGNLDAAVRLVRQLGGSGPIASHTYDSGTVITMADPEVNEFCLVGAKGEPSASFASAK